MYKSLLGAFIAVAFMFGITAYNAPEPVVPVKVPSLQEEVLNATVRVEVIGPTGAIVGGGSATAIDNVHFLTNEHVVARMEEGWAVQVRGWIRENGKVYPVIYDAKVIAADKETDLAMLEIEGYWIGAVGWLASEEPPEASEVCKSGAALGLRPRVTCGMWAGTNERMSGKIRHVSHAAPTAPGDSGGGIWANMGGRYQVVAVTRAVPNLGKGGLVTTMGLGIPLEVVREFVNEALKK